MMQRHHHQHGFAAVAAVFLVVVLAALGGYMMTFSNTQQLTSAQDVQGTRAYWAARAGLEWAVARHVGAAACAAANTALVIEGLNVNVGCVIATYADAGLNAGVNPRIFRLTSTASNGAAVGTVGYVERSVSAALEN